jgi:hypothetical protein
MTSKSTPSSGAGTHSHIAPGDWDQVIKRSMQKMTRHLGGSPRRTFGTDAGPVNYFSSESLILAQDERWRHA